MSFRNPFKKPDAPKKSVISKTAEREFEREVKRLEQLDENTKQIYRDMRSCIEAHAAQSRAECKMTSNLLNSPLCREEESLRQRVEQWNITAHKIEALTSELNANSQKAVVDPMKKFSSIFPSVQNAVKKWEQALQEYSRSQAKVDKYKERERTGTNIIKLDSGNKSLQQAKDEFDGQNSALLEDMPKLYEGRIEYIKPSFQALIRSQIKYYAEAHKLYSEMAGQLAENDDDTTEDSVDQRIQQNLAEIRGLAITVDD